MIKQVYRYLSVFLMLNLIFSPAGIAKSQKNVDKASENTCQNKYKSSNPVNNQDPANKDPNLEKKPVWGSGEGRFTTLYGVQDIKDFYNSYEYEVINPENTHNTYPAPNNQ